MGREQIMQRMTFIMYGEDICRVNISEESDGTKTIMVDLHGLNRKSAAKMISNIIAMFMFPFNLVLIHGYNHGTVLKEYIAYDLNNPRITKKSTPYNNPGITYLTIDMYKCK